MPLRPRILDRSPEDGVSVLHRNYLPGQVQHPSWCSLHQTRCDGWTPRMATEMYKTHEADDNNVVQKSTVHTCCNFYYIRNKFRRQQVNKIYLLQIYNMAVYSTNHFRNIQMPSNSRQLLTTTSVGPATMHRLLHPATSRPGYWSTLLSLFLPFCPVSLYFLQKTQKWTVHKTRYGQQRCVLSRFQTHCKLHVKGLATSKFDFLNSLIV